MPELWTPLKLHGVQDTPSLVSKLLATLPGQHFRDHLIGRRVQRVVLAGAIASGAYLWRTADSRKFHIYLSFSKTSTIEDWLVSIGHELGHTFAYGIRLFPPMQLRWPSTFGDENEEDFCEQFGVSWAALHGGHPELRSLLLEQLEKTRADVVNEQNKWRHVLFDFLEVD